MLMVREPFGSIVEGTLREYYQERTNAPTEVRWYDRNPGRAAIIADGFQPWFGNRHLNFFAAPGTATPMFENLRREYSRSAVCWKRPVQWLYVRIATQGLGLVACAQVALGVRPPRPEAGQCLILGGNNRLRLLYPQAGKCAVVLKKGFDERSIREEIAFRSGLRLPFAPRMTAVSPKADWFEEDYVAGTPINRLAQKREEACARRACDFVRDHVAAPTLRQQPARVRLLALAEDICAVQRSTPLLRQRTDIVLLASRCKKVVENVFSCADTIATAQVHGDFQAANILIDDDRLWVIDWESTGRRFSAYDPIGLALVGRHPNGLASRLKILLQSSEHHAHALLEGWPGISWDRSNRARLLLAYLVEELEFYVTENSNPLFTRLGEALLSFLAELPACLGVLEAEVNRN